MILPLASWSSLKFHVIVCYPEILDLRSLCKSAHWHEHSCQESQSRQASRDLSRSCIPGFSFSLQEPLFRESFLRLRFHTGLYVPGGPCCHTFCCLSPFPTRSLLGCHSLSFPLAAVGSWASWVHGQLCHHLLWPPSGSKHWSGGVMSSPALSRVTKSHL